MSIQRKTSKTEFMRYLDRFPPTNDSRYLEIRSHKKRWGQYLKWKYKDQFDKLYEDFWLKHPESWVEAYDNNETQP